MDAKQTLQLARQGNPEAIATILNRALVSRGITATVCLDRDRLKIQLTSDPPPSQQALIPSLEKAFLTLSPPGLRGVTFYGLQEGSMNPIWSRIVDFIPAEKQTPLETAIQPATDSSLAAPSTATSDPSASEESTGVVDEAPEEGTVVDAAPEENTAVDAAPEESTVVDTQPDVRSMEIASPEVLRIVAPPTIAPSATSPTLDQTSVEEEESPATVPPSVSHIHSAPEPSPEVAPEAHPPSQDEADTPVRMTSSYTPIPKEPIQQEPITSLAELLESYQAGNHIFVNAQLASVDLAGAYLPKVVFTGADLSQSSLSGTTLESANLTAATLREANLSESNLRGADLCRSNLEGAVLERANARQANFSECILSATDWRGANLSEAKFANAALEGAWMQQANLRGADFRGAKLDNVLLQGACFSHTTQFDRDFSPEAAGMIRLDDPEEPPES